MGFFSWKTLDTNCSISNVWSVRGSFPVALLIPKEFVEEIGSNRIIETLYAGYGVFGGQDAYSLLAKWNVPNQCRDANGDWLPDDKTRITGIDIGCYEKDMVKLKYKLRFVEASNPCKYEDFPEDALSETDPDQGFFYEESEEL